jgi:hypothetical protein
VELVIAFFAAAGVVSAALLTGRPSRVAEPAAGPVAGPAVEAVPATAVTRRPV